MAGEIHEMPTSHVVDLELVVSLPMIAPECRYKNNKSRCKCSTNTKILGVSRYGEAKP